MLMRQTALLLETRGIVANVAFDCWACTIVCTNGCLAVANVCSEEYDSCQRTGALAVASLLVVAIQECTALRSGEHTVVVRCSHEILNL